MCWVDLLVLAAVSCFPHVALLTRQEVSYRVIFLSSVEYERYHITFTLPEF